jgi:carboxylesterase type B
MAAITTTAHTSFGSLRVVAHEGVVIFRGIPYAKPPVGQRRFAPPEPLDGWAVPAMPPRSARRRCRCSLRWRGSLGLGR